MVSVGFVYLLIIAGHPVNMARYLIPLLPLAAVFIGLGCTAVIRSRAPATRAVAPLAYLAMGWLVFGNLLWTRHYEQVARLERNAGFGFTLPFDWRGFDEAIRWVAANTPHNAVLASHYDTTYVVYTGRRGIRPWVHEPETYDPRYGRYGQWAPTGNVPALLERAHVSYLIIDPFLPDGMGAHAAAAVQAALHAPGATWDLKFTSSDGQHRIFERRPAGAP